MSLRDSGDSLSGTTLVMDVADAEDEAEETEDDEPEDDKVATGVSTDEKEGDIEADAEGCDGEVARDERRARHELTCWYQD